MRNGRGLAALVLGAAGMLAWTLPAQAQEAAAPVEAAEEPAIVGQLLDLVRAQDVWVKREPRGASYATLAELTTGNAPLLPAVFAPDGEDATAALGAFQLRVLFALEDGGFGARPALDVEDEDLAWIRTELCQSVWCAYAWPASDASLPTYFVSQYGTVLTTKPGAYVADTPPDGRAAFAATRYDWVMGVDARDVEGCDASHWRTVRSVDDDPGDHARRARDAHRRIGSRNRQHREVIRWRSIAAAAGTTTQRRAHRFLERLGDSQRIFQRTFKVDLDGDRRGEFASMGELTGRRRPRAAADGTEGDAEAEAVQRFIRNERWDAGDVLIGDYRIRIFLPSDAGAVHDGGGATFEGGAVSTNAAERAWCAYAWPDSGEGATYVVNQAGKILVCLKSAYRGVETPPLPGAAFQMGGLQSITGLLAIDADGQDGNSWVRPRSLVEALREQKFSEAERTAGNRLQAEAESARDVGPPKTWSYNQNEVAAIATLRNLTSAQAQFQATAKSDVDWDGVGEFGTFQELSGAIAVRDEADGSNAEGRVLYPAILSAAFKRVSDAGTVERGGYHFKIWLPAEDGTGLSETKGRVLAEGEIHSDTATHTWCGYAWPVKPGKTGNFTFFTNQEGDILGAQGADYGGTAKPPRAGAAFKGGGLDVITGEAAVESEGQDGNDWIQIN